jgi:ZIP family zinc transporter
MHPLIPSLLAGLATLLGSLIVLLGKYPGRRAIALFLGGAAGVMLAVVLLDLLPASLATGSPLEVGAGFLAGIAILWLLDHLLNRQANAATSRQESYRRMGYLICTGIALHDLPEGMAIAGAYAVGGGLGPLLALSIALHNIPEGIATTAPLELGGIRKARVLAVNLLISIFTPLGTLIGLFLLRLSPQHLSFLLALAAGAMVYLIKDELLPAAQHQSQYWCWFGVIVGYFILWCAQAIRS